MLLELRKTAPKDVRKNSQVPGVIYGKDFQPTSVKVDTKELHKTYQQFGQVMTFNVELEGKKHRVYFKDAQFELFNNGQITHFDLHKITGDTLMTADVPVIINGRERLETKKLFLEMVMQTIPAQYPADKAIASFEFDVSEFDTDDAIYIKDLEVEEGIEILAEPEQMVFIVKEPTVVEEVVEEKTEESEEATE